MKKLVRRASLAIRGSGNAESSSDAIPSTRRSGRKKLQRRASLAVRKKMGGVSRPHRFELLGGDHCTVHVSPTTTVAEACVRIRKQVRAVSVQRGLLVVIDGFGCFCACVRVQMHLHNDGDFALFDWCGPTMKLLEDSVLIGGLIEQWAAEAESAAKAKTKGLFGLHVLHVTCAR